MKKKKVILLFIIILIALTSSILFVVLEKKELSEKPSNKKEIIKEDFIKKEDTKEENTVEEGNTVEEEKPTEEINPITESKPTTNNNQTNTQIPNNYNNNYSNNNNNYSNNSNNNSNGGGSTPSTPNIPPVQQPVYSCPGGYTLSGTICTSTIEASFDCPNGLTSFSDGTVSGCINTSEIYTPAGGSCQPGEGTLMQIQIGGPSTNQCVPIRGQKTYMCPNGYTLSGTTCTSVIPATVTQGRIKTKAKKIIRV